MGSEDVVSPGRSETALPWRRRHAAAPAQGLALAALGFVKPLLFVPAVIALLVGAVQVTSAVRRVARRCRGLAAAWGNVEIAEPYRPEPSAPRPRHGGLYRHGMKLYGSDRRPRHKRRAQQVFQDPATWRDLTWLLLDPVIGAPLALLPAALIAGGSASVVMSVWQFAAGGDGPGVHPALLGTLGVVAVLAGGATGPWLLGVHSRWTRLLLGPPPATRLAEDGWWSRTRRRVQSLGGGIVLCAIAACGLLLAALQLAALVLTVPTGLIFAYPKAVALSRRLTRFFRWLAGEWAGVGIPAPYLPEPPAPVRGADGYYEYRHKLYPKPQLPRYLQLLRYFLTDPATWRDLLWLVVNPLVSAVLLILPIAAAIFAVFGFAVPGMVGAVFGSATPGTFWTDLAQRLPAGSALLGTGWLGVPVAVLLTVFVVWVFPYGLRAQARFSRLLLAPTRRSQLAQRVERLTETRADATGAQVDELRRIERDLHDGAQARLVAIGMTLRALERRLSGASDEVREMVIDVRENSVLALAELRHLVRGIHPPVLAERGLADALRALALDTPMNVEVTVELPGKPEPPVEACAYFATCEALTNATKHSGASRVQIDLRYSDGILWITVSDDGCGGADPALGSGLRGIQRRLGTFDGTLAVSSPPTGPTTLKMELPCVLSSPRTSTS